MNQELVADILYGKARKLPGSGLDDDDLIRIVQEEFPGQQVYVVRQWLLLDVMLPEVEQKEIKSRGLAPTVLFANHLVSDSEDGAPKGEAIISNYESELFGCLFQSENALFILAGPGGRRYVGQPAVAALRASNCRQSHALLVHEV